MKKRNPRWSWIIPAASIIVAVHAYFCDRHAYMHMAIVQMTLMQCVTLGIPEALRRACGRSASRTQVAGLSLTAFLFASLVTMLGFGLSESRWLGVSIPPLTIGGLLICIRCVQEFFYASDDNTSALLTEILAALAIVALPLMDFDGNALVSILTVNAVLVIALVIALLSGWKGRSEERVKPEVTLFVEIAPSFVRAVTYPALIALIWISGAPDNLIVATVGLLVLELSRCPFRRDEHENAPFLVSITLFMALASMLALYTHGFSVKMLMAAGFTAVLMYGRFNFRTVLVALLMLLGMVSEMGYAIGYIGFELSEQVACGYAFAALLLTLPEWLELNRRRRVRRIRRRAMKARARR